MKLLRVALCCICFTLPAQSPEVVRAHRAYDAFAKLANKWSDNHDDYIRNFQDSERLEAAVKAWDKFFRLAKDAEWINKKGKAIR